LSQKPTISIQFKEEEKLFPPHLVQKKFNEIHLHYNLHNMVGAEIASRLTERLEDLKRDFHHILDLGAGTGLVADKIKESNPKSNIYALDFSEKLLQQSQHINVIANAEGALPYADETFDLVISNMLLPFINDIPKVLHIAGKSLKKDGLFLASTLGLESFKEFRESFQQAGLGDGHVFPLPDVKSVGAALQRLGYALPVVDRDIITISYPNLSSIYKELKNLGARNINLKRSKALTGKNKWRKMEHYYQEHFSLEDGSLQLTLEVIYLHGFRPHASQPKALKPGSGQKSIAEVLKST
jgi:NADH dehydrogenase [ubiquinone] 1 alpha subcomplex assembly factor 5